MRVRTITAQVQSGQVDEFARRWHEQVAPQMRGIPGLRGVYLVANRDANTVMAVQVWDTPSDQATHQPHQGPRFRDQVRDILASGEPVATEYEVLVQF